MNTKKIIFRNIVCSILLQLITVLSGFIIPKIILLYFGSATNGLISSINQFLSCVSLLEGGVSSVITASLYKPLEERNWEKINGVVNAATSFFRKLAIIYLVYSVVVAVIYPFFVKTKYCEGYVFAMVLVLAINGFVQYFFSITYKLLLNADQKVYFVSLVQIIVVGINMILVVISAKVFRDVLILKLVSAIVFLIQPIMYGVYVKKNYQIDKKAAKNRRALEQRWDGFGQNLAFFIHSNTDILILTAIATLKDVSVYSVYLQIGNGLTTFATAMSTAIIPSMGKILVSGDKKKINNSFDIYEFGMDFIIAFLFSCGIVLLLPFIRVYTAEITDANYIQPVFGNLLLLAKMIYCLRDPYVSITYASGHFKQTAKYAYMEAIINIVISVLLVFRFGLVGIALGTLLSMVYRMIAHIIYLKKNILYRPVKKFVKNIIVFGIGMLGSVAISQAILTTSVTNYMQWIMLGVKTAWITILVLCALSCIFYRKEVMKIMISKRKCDK